MSDRRPRMCVPSAGEGGPVHRFAHEAMATTFEVFVVGESTEYARQAAAAAFQELDRAEEELSRFVETSDIAQLRALRAGEAIRVGIYAFECLQTALRVQEETNGAFDVAFASTTPEQPSPLLELDDGDHSVRVRASRVQIDLGGIGKGYAIDQMANMLNEWSIETALIDSGQSTVLAFSDRAWPIGLRDPEHQDRSFRTLHLRNGSLSGSGTLLHGPHIIVPRTGRPTSEKLATWAKAPTAALSDALSTAFMVMGLKEIEGYCQRHPRTGAMVMLRETRDVICIGRWE